MAVIICKQCGYENPEGSQICEICAEPLQAESASIQQPVMQTSSVIAEQAATVIQDSAEPGDGKEYYVLCPESQTKTIVTGGNITSFYCEGCKRQHDIDGFLWSVEMKSKEISQVVDVSPSSSAVKGDSLWLEEVNSHVRIEIDKAGGTLGRYGKFGADFFQSRNMLMVSGEHCIITYEFGNWVIRHISKTNQTMYNNMILGTNEPKLLEDGKILTLANAVSFVVRIG